MESNPDFTSDLLNGILHSSTQVSVILTGLDQTVRFRNKGAENLFGYTAERRYKRAFSHEEAFRIIVEAKGEQFDPDLVEVFKELEGEFKKIRDRFSVADFSPEA